jgi:hypothetical protein
VILHSKIGGRKSNLCPFGSRKWFSLSVTAHVAVAGKKRCAPAEKSVINMISLVLSVFDWPIIMIGPGGLLLVVPPPIPICCPSFSFIGGFAKMQLNLDVKNIFGGSHTEHSWRCS